MSDIEEFLAGERPEDVAIYVADSVVDDPGALADHGERRGDGLVLVLDGEQGRSVFQTATGVDPLAFARNASGVEGTIRRDLTGGTCPDDDGTDDHEVRFMFCFSETQKDDVEGRYAEGDVVHAYAQCSCGTAYSERWLAGESE